VHNIIRRFSALQRAEIAEIHEELHTRAEQSGCFSALQRAEIAEIVLERRPAPAVHAFQCSSTSRNC